MYRIITYAVGLENSVVSFLQDRTFRIAKVTIFQTVKNETGADAGGLKVRSNGGPALGWFGKGLPSPDCGGVIPEKFLKLCMQFAEFGVNPKGQNYVKTSC